MEPGLLIAAGGSRKVGARVPVILDHLLVEEVALGAEFPLERFILGRQERLASPAGRLPAQFLNLGDEPLKLLPGLVQVGQNPGSIAVQERSQPLQLSPDVDPRRRRFGWNLIAEQQPGAHSAHPPIHVSGSKSGRPPSR